MLPVFHCSAFLLLALWSFEPVQCLNDTTSKTCKIAGTANDYMGSLNMTRSNRTCQQWLVNSPHKVSAELLNASLFADGNLTAVHNFCRNPDRGLAGAWCYTTDPALESDTCDVRDCERPQSEGCTIITNGHGEGRDVYVRRQWRGKGAFRFWLKEWDPDQPDGILFELKPRNGTQMYRLVVGAEDNSMVILTFHDNGEERVLKQKTLLHLIPTGQWGAFWLRINEGSLVLGGIEEDEETTIFRWTADRPEDTFLPAFVTFISVVGGKIGVGLPCDECHVERTTTKHSTKMLPIPLWMANPPSYQRNLTLHIRGVGGLMVPLMRRVGLGNYFILTIGERFDTIFLLRQIPSGEILELHKVSVGYQLIEPGRWNSFFVSFNETHLNVSRNGVHLMEVNSTEPLIFYWFSTVVQRGAITWAANCEPDEVDVEPVDGGWSPYGPFNCSVPCGGGTGAMTRNCTAPAPNLFGRDCEGSDRVAGNCNQFPCGDISPDTVELVAERLRASHTSLLKAEGARIAIELDPLLLMSRVRVESPTANWSWTLNGRPLPANDSRLSVVLDVLHIEGCRYSDSGVYAAVLQRPSGQRLVLSVTALSVLSAAADFRPRLLSPVKLVCHGRVLGHVYAELEQRWLHDGVVWKDYGLTTVDAVNEVTISNLRMSHTGTWKCVVSQPDLGFSWVTNVVRVQVRLAPTFLTHLMEDDFTAPFFGHFGSERYVGCFLVAVVLFTASAGVFGVYAYLRWCRLPPLKPAVESTSLLTTNNSDSESE